MGAVASLSHHGNDEAAPASVDDLLVRLPTWCPVVHMWKPNLSRSNRRSVVPALSIRWSGTRDVTAGLDVLHGLTLFFGFGPSVLAEF